MNRWRWRLAAMAALASMFAPVLPIGLAVGAQSAPTRIVLEITDTGYRCAEGCAAVNSVAGPWEPVLEVPQGAVVELGFRWAHQSHTNEEHIMVVEGLALETDKLTAKNREGWIRFVASNAGTFTVKCDLECELHDSMQRARLRVTAGGGGGAAAAANYTPTTLELSAPSSIITGFDPVVLQAKVSDSSGKPVLKAQVSFFTEAEFAGVRELVHIGTAVTDAEGVARQQFKPLSAEPEQKVVARFATSGVYDKSEHQIALHLTGSPPSAYHYDGTGFEGVRASVRVLVVLLFAAIWTTLGWIFVQALRVGRTGRTELIDTGTAVTVTARAPGSAVDEGSNSRQGRNS